ncbi:MAG: hypothetical protein WC517_00480 [Patescibacteria group bacterium]
MREISLSPESKKEITREEVIAAYKKFIERGVTNPNNLGSENPEVKEANELFYAWQTQEDERAEGDHEQELRVNLAKTMLYVDAGFNDPDYLAEVLHDWLAQDSQNAGKQSDNPERAETRRQIAQAMNKIRAILKASN